MEGGEESVSVFTDHIGLVDYAFISFIFVEEQIPWRRPLA